MSTYPRVHPIRHHDAYKNKYNKLNNNYLYRRINQKLNLHFIVVPR